MMGPIRPMIAACLVCGMFMAFTARAESGRITFSGAIVAPTCATPVDMAALAADDRSSSRTYACGGRAQVAAGTADGVSSYALSVTRVGADETAGSPLLQYYAGYLAAAHGGDARMVTRTYQ